MTETRRPNLLLLAGCNGAGKSTLAPMLLRDELGITEFVNADVIAQGLSGFNPDEAGLAAGRVTLERLHSLGRARQSFAFESTLASKSFAPWIRELREAGYRFHLVFVWLPSPDLAIARVAKRVALGGHDIPEDVIRRRYEWGLKNFFDLYSPFADLWRFYDNSTRPRRLLARGGLGLQEVCFDVELWSQLQRVYRSEAGP